MVSCVPVACCLLIRSALQRFICRHRGRSHVCGTARRCDRGSEQIFQRGSAGRVAAAHTRYRQAHDLVAASSLSASLRQECDLITRYNMARIALSVHDAATARSEAAAYTRRAAATRNGDRVRQAHERPRRGRHRLAYDARAARVLLFGGWAPENKQMTDLWTLRVGSGGWQRQSLR